MFSVFEGDGWLACGMGACVPLCPYGRSPLAWAAPGVLCDARCCLARGRGVEGAETTDERVEGVSACVRGLP